MVSAERAAALRKAVNVSAPGTFETCQPSLSMSVYRLTGSKRRRVKVKRLTLNGPRPRVVQYGHRDPRLSFDHLVGAREQHRGTSGPSAFAVFRWITNSNLTSGHATATGASLAHRRLYRRDRKWLAKNATSQAWSRFPEAINDTALGRCGSPAELVPIPH